MQIVYTTSNFKGGIYRAVLAILLGLALLIWPADALKYVVMLIGIVFLAIGIIAFIISSRNREEHQRSFAPLSGIGSVILGLLLVCLPSTFATVFMFLLGFILVVAAVGQFVTLAAARQFGRIAPVSFLFPVLILIVGIVILLWSVIKVLNSTEMTMNRIWGVRKGRSLRRMFTDYFSIIFIAPILMILVSSLNLLMTGSGWQENFPLISSFLQVLIKLLPYMLVWMLFIFLYMFMPATPVKFKHAFVAAMIAGTVYQIIQWFYIRFQIGMSSYSAIYGTLAALPLLLVWLQLSWSVVLWGTELCYIFRNRHFMYKNELFGDTAWMETLECALKIMKFVARVYVNGDGGPSLGMINKELKINTGKLRIVLQELVDLHILVEAKEEDDYFYYPASDLHAMSVGDIIIRFSRVDESRDAVWKKQFKETVLSGFAGDRLIADSGIQQ